MQCVLDCVVIHSLNGKWIIHDMFTYSIQQDQKCVKIQMEINSEYEYYIHSESNKSCMEWVEVIRTEKCIWFVCVKCIQNQQTQKEISTHYPPVNRHTHTHNQICNYTVYGGVNQFSVLCVDALMMMMTMMIKIHHNLSKYGAACTIQLCVSHILPWCASSIALRSSTNVVMSCI